MKQQLPDLLLAAQTNNHRLPVLLSGSMEWLQEQLAETTRIMDKTPSLWSDNQQWLPAASPWKKARKLLGQTIDFLILDLTEDIPADALGAVTGALRGGGLLVFLAPEELHWPSDSCFLMRASKIFSDAKIHHWREGQESPQVIPNQRNINESASIKVPAPCVTEDQLKAVAAAKRVLTGHRRRPLVLTADRGRGKSAALGIAAAQLMLERPVKILVTAPSQQAVETLFAHAADIIGQPRVNKFHIKTDDSELAFIAPDDMVLNKPDGNLVMVDEAASIPAPLLTELLKQYSRIIFASTIHGYEGTGRGFAVRFRKTLDQITPKWQPCEMEHPIRWATGDPLEQFLTQLLLLEAEPADRNMIADAKIDNVDFITLSSKDLINQPDVLKELFGLLILAHYQTSPDDLRQILDQDNISVSVLMFQGRVIATALVSTEGEFEQSLAQAVWSGKRRIKGHLLPQTLASHGGFPEAPLLKWARIMRIAVHPDIQSQGLGQYFVSQLIQEHCKQGYDLIGSSFGATTDLVHFWQRCQLMPVHIGSTRNKASGCYSLVVCKGLSEQGQIFEQKTSQRFFRTFPFLCRDGLQQLETELLLGLLAQTHQGALTEEETQRLNDYSEGFLNYDSCLPELQTLACSLLPRFAEELSQIQRQLLTDKLLQNRSWTETINRSLLKGKRFAEQELACSVACLLKVAKAS
ncbi:GNAT family N-acetyltransferase [Sansalvadorimonas sp. 2012CJ34-2]|uniref:tRNA(Met) cytidine acetyltransferase TmcA n=1 Tax=Parendozoicomonas callyspongiae TaxID=2942213 RepID=A0ABT0PBI2_9GAMM|nr:GNAT family N-acetyltransferase [Sansalvadorimonas sp. 2012CJ34-2]MCL6268675.1 GNAT family N-acetyltransferase [Sansalvadorimonas sp. 2012CJ34-2]